MITVEAKRLTGIDRGKTASFSLENPERHYTGNSGQSNTPARMRP